MTTMIVADDSNPSTRDVMTGGGLTASSQSGNGKAPIPPEPYTQQSHEDQTEYG